jgi:hypothetical protein
MQKNFLKNSFVGVLKVNHENSRIRIQILIRLVRGMNPGIRIHAKLSWIWNTAIYLFKAVL